MEELCHCLILLTVCKNDREPKTIQKLIKHTHKEPEPEAARPWQALLGCSTKLTTLLSPLSSVLLSLISVASSSTPIFRSSPLTLLFIQLGNWWFCYDVLVTFWRDIGQLYMKLSCGFVYSLMDVTCVHYGFMKL